MKTNLLVSLFFSLLIASTSLYATDFPAPPDAEVATISGSTTSLGINLQIRKFEVDLPLESALKFYQDFWKDEFAESFTPPWNMIGKRIDDEYFNVQVQKRGKSKSWGYLSISNLPELLDKKTYTPPSAKNFPIMGGSQVLDDQTSNDPGKTGRVLLIKNNFSPKTNHSFYKKHYKNNGWSIVMDQSVQSRNAGYALYVSKGSKVVSLTISKAKDHTSIVANEVNRGLLR